MIWRVLLIILLTCLLTPGGQARPGPGRVQFRPRLARTTREHQAPLDSSLHHSELVNSQFRTQVTSRLPLPQLRFVITNLISHPRDPPLGPLIPPHATLSVQPQPFPLFPARVATRRNLQRLGGPFRLVYFLCVVMRVSCTRARASWNSRSWCVLCVYEPRLGCVDLSCSRSVRAPHGVSPMKNARREASTPSSIELDSFAVLGENTK